MTKPTETPKPLERISFTSAGAIPRRIRERQEAEAKARRDRGEEE